MKSQGKHKHEEPLYCWLLLTEPILIPASNFNLLIRAYSPYACFATTGNRLEACM